jgi:hypothetical protein
LLPENSLCIKAQNYKKNMENSLFSSNFETKSKNFETLIFPPRYAGLVRKIRKTNSGYFPFKGHDIQSSNFF